MITECLIRRPFGISCFGTHDDGGENDNCSIFFEDADKSFLTDRGIDKVTIAEKLTYG